MELKTRQSERLRKWGAGFGTSAQHRTAAQRCVRPRANRRRFFHRFRQALTFLRVMTDIRGVVAGRGRFEAGFRGELQP